jgi:hypothetical protein
VGTIPLSQRRIVGIQGILRNEDTICKMVNLGILDHFQFTRPMTISEAIPVATEQKECGQCKDQKSVHVSLRSWFI